MKKLSAIFLLLSLFAACLVRGQLPYGKVIDSVYCKNDSSLSYALFLPSYYDDRDDWPIIYAFDPAARGNVPVELFSHAAEKYGFIVAGSNNVRNGPWDPLYKAADEMFKDTWDRLTLDPERFYATGFSGGSRAASSIAMITEKFSGIIGCGAGFSPGYPPNFNIQFDYVGIIGNRDFNFQEMMNLDRWLKTFNVDHETIEFEGGHDWPPEWAIDKAVLWMKIRSMGKHYKYMDYYLLLDFREEYEARGKRLLEEKEYEEAFRNYQYMVTALRGIKEVEQYELLMYEIMSHPEFKEAVNLKKRLFEIENMHILEYRDAFRAYRSVEYEPGVEVQPIKWWKKQVKTANRYIDRAETVYDTLLGERLIDFIWRTAYMQYEAVLNTQESRLAPIYLEIWSLAKPDWAAPHYLASRYYAGEVETAKAVDELEIAIDKGYSDLEAIRNDSMLETIWNDRKFRRLTTPPDTLSTK